MQIRLTVQDPVTHMYYQTNLYMTVTDPAEIAVLFDTIVLGYSNLLINSVRVFLIEIYPDGDRTGGTDSESPNLYGAILPTTNMWFPTITSVLYYYVKDSDNVLSRRMLIWSYYFEYTDGENISDALWSYLSTQLENFFNGSICDFYTYNYRRMRFDHLDKKIYHRTGYQYPRRVFRYTWPV